MRYRYSCAQSLSARLALAMALAGGLVLPAASASATPEVHAVTGSHVDIDVKLGGAVIGSATAGITGDSITIDADPGVLTIDAIRLEIAATTISLSQPFGGYDEITVESAVLEGAVGFHTSISSGVPSLFTAVAGPLTVTGSWGATDSTLTNPDTSGNPITYDVISLIAIVNQNPLVEMDSVTINSIDGTPFGHPGEHLTIVANYVVTGSLGGGGGLPEPGTGLLFSVSLMLLARRRASGRKRRDAHRA